MCEVQDLHLGDRTKFTTLQAAQQYMQKMQELFPAALYRINII